MNPTWAARVHESRVAALQRRAALHSGAARQAIELQLQQLRSSQAATCAPGTEAGPTAANRLSPLAALLTQLASQAAPAGELKTVSNYRSSWVQLGVQQRLTQSRAKVPDNAGPLNTERLMHQALSLMGETSPAYLQHFMAHVQTLLALEQLGGPAPAPRKDGARRARST